MFTRAPLRLYFLQSLYMTYTLGSTAYLGWSLFAKGSELTPSLLPLLAIASLGCLVFFFVLAWIADAKKLSPNSDQWTYAGLYTFFVSLVVSLHVTDFSFSLLFDAEGTAGAARLFRGLIHANLSLLPEAIIEVFETIFVAFLATAISVPLAFVVAFFCAKNLMIKPWQVAIYLTLRTFLNITRSIEPLIWAVIFSVWVGIGPFAGMLALMIHSVASLAKQYSEIIESVDEGPIDGIRATGARPVQVIWFGIVPQVVLPYIAFTFYRWDINVRMATVIGLAGGGGIGTLLLKYQGQAMWPEVGCIILVIASVVWLMDTASAYVREAVK